ncbi:MAG: Rrf2 family transcriptional regulator [Candidatus Goldbacteria bacterium]|nr:Rrf2 family transcriptional regulator [Candidatus Goldiibacteriota bacterium]
MKISTKGRYALRALTHLAYSYIKNNNAPVSIKDINKKEQISMRYLENIFVKLRKAGLVLSLKGEKGGFYLSREPSKINLYQILSAAETHFTPSSCVVNSKFCKRTSFCGIRKIWQKLDEKIKEFLLETTLMDVMALHLIEKRS